MTLQYARLFLLRSGISIISELEPLSKDELKDRLQNRKSINASIEESGEGAKDIIEILSNTRLILKTQDGYRVTTKKDISKRVENNMLLYSGREVLGVEDERFQADRILTNIMYEYPMLILLCKYIYRYGPVKNYEIKREFDGDEFLGDKMNSFTINVGLNLLRDADAIDKTEEEYFIGNRWPVRFFCYVICEEYFDLLEEEVGAIKEPELFERLETMYGIERDTFNKHLSTLHNEGIITEGSYEELILNSEKLNGARIVGKSKETHI